MTHLYNSKSPNLPMAGKEYSCSQNEQMINALRLYFSKLDNALLNLANIDGGGWLHFPHAMFVSVLNQSSSANNTPTLVTAEVTTVASGVAMSSGKLTVTKSGTYRVQYSLQFSNTDTLAHFGIAWFMKNGVDVVNSGFTFDVRSSHGGEEGHTVANCELFVDLTKEDYIQLWWATDQAKTGLATGVFIQNYAASVSPYARPDIPSVVVTVMFVCAANQ